MKIQARGIIYFLLVLMATLAFLQACQQASPKFEVVSLTIMPPDVTVGEETTIRAEIRNNGVAIETYDVPLMVDGVAEERNFISLAPGASETVTFSLVKHEPGDYKITIGNETSVLVVHSPSELHLSELTVSPAEISPGGKTTIIIKVANTGGTEGKYIAPLNINDTAEDVVVATVAAGTSQTLTFDISKDTPGAYTVTLGELTGQFVVTEPVITIWFGSTDNTSCPPNTRYSQRTGC